MIPESIVSLLIGYKGKTVKKIMEDSGTQVNVNHPIGNLEFRPVTIKGNEDAIMAAIKMVMQLVDDMINTVRDKHRKGANLKDLEDNIVSAKFV